MENGVEEEMIHLEGQRMYDSINTYLSHEHSILIVKREVLAKIVRRR